MKQTSLNRNILGFGRRQSEDERDMEWYDVDRTISNEEIINQCLVSQASLNTAGELRRTNEAYEESDTDSESRQDPITDGDY